MALMARVLHEELLRGVHPALVLLVRTWQVQCEFDVRIWSGVRTNAEQRKLYEQGRTTPGKIVTNAADASHSPHGLRQVNGRIWGCAVDAGPCLVTGEAWDNTDAYEEMAKWAYRRTNVSWGGRWATLVDERHWELLEWKDYTPATDADTPDFADVRGGSSSEPL